MDKEAEWLLRDKYGGEKSEAFFADCRRLALCEPLAYLIGWVPFLDCKVWLDSKPLIPRPETEFWTKEAIAVITQKQASSFDPSHSSVRVLDLCAGSGCIGVAVAKAVPVARVDLSEIDARHLPTIRKNLAENGIADERATPYHTSLFDKLPFTYDFILSNPPYIDPSLDRTESSVRTHEPHLALYGGREGLEIIERIIEAAPAHLTPGGQLWLEHEPEQSAAIAMLGTTHHFTTTTHKDQYQVERYSILVLQ